jgi:ADP-heptose:LPS heptosyltransferase
MIDILNKNHYEIYMIDIEKKYQNFKNKVQYYLTNTTLQDVKNLINRCDLYIGGDSFLIHLAYYLKRNYFIFFYRENDDFLPPNVLEDFYIKINDSIDFNSVLEKKFKNIGLVR